MPTLIIVLPQTLLCDFCSSPHVAARYHAEDFTVEALSTPDFHQDSVGDWAACELCAKLIDAGNWNTLLTHAVTSFYETQPEMYGQLPVEAVTLHLLQMYSQLRNSNFHKVEL